MVLRLPVRVELDSVLSTYRDHGFLHPAGESIVEALVDDWLRVSLLVANVKKLLELDWAIVADSPLICPLVRLIQQVMMRILYSPVLPALPRPHSQVP